MQRKIVLQLHPLENMIVMELDKNEWNSLKPKFSTSIKGCKVKRPSAFTEKGLYMLATILKSPQAIQATLSIIETLRIK